MRKIIFILILFFFFIFVPKAHAVTKTSGSLQLTCDEPLFPSQVVWAPGMSQEKEITVKNLGTSSQQVQIASTNYSETGLLSEQLLLTVTEGGTNLYQKSLKDFFSAGEVGLSDVGAGQTNTYKMTVYFASESGNQYQGKEAKFDLIVGFKGGETLSVSGDGGGTAGETGGTGGCTDQAPAGAPTLLSATASLNSVTLVWSEASDPVSYYLIAYGQSPGKYLYGNPSVGGKGTTSFTIANLSGGIPYYFVVRAGNGCTPGPFSNELSAVPLGGFIMGIAQGFSPGVLGEATEPAKIEGNVKGVSEDSTSPKPCTDCIWWPIILAQIIISLAYFYMLRKYKSLRIFVFGLIIPTLAYLIFIISNRPCLTNYFFGDFQNFFCRFFLILDFMAFILIYSLQKKIFYKD